MDNNFGHTIIPTAARIQRYFSNPPVSSFTHTTSSTQQQIQWTTPPQSNPKPLPRAAGTSSSSCPAKAKSVSPNSSPPTPKLKSAASSATLPRTSCPVKLKCATLSKRGSSSLSIGDMRVCILLWGHRWR